MRRPVAHRDLGRHADARQRLALERCRVEGLGRRQQMDVEVDRGRRHIFDRGKALVEGARREQPPHQVVRHRRAGAIMHGEALQDLRTLEPVLVELRGQLDEVGRTSVPEIAG